ncbi:4-hydroxyphenylacetate decarboxylase activating enzyme [Proteus vulgaris]|nr:4-hydroxyphenylacetate decarboxylase activating enzyme [Proteus vulgaris]
MEMAAEIRGRIFNIQKYSIYDGDGIRTLVFLKGCNIRCLGVPIQKVSAVSFR